MCSFWKHPRVYALGALATKRERVITGDLHLNLVAGGDLAKGGGGAVRRGQPPVRRRGGGDDNV